VTKGSDVESRRLARVAQELLGGSFSHAKHEVEVGHVTVNDEVVADPGAWVRPGDRVEHRPELPHYFHAGKARPLTVLHLDADVLVIDKPAGLLVHPTWAGEQDTVITRAVAELSRRSGRRERVFVVHRLDRATSGVMLLARTQPAVKQLQLQFRAHSTERRYQALVRGDLNAEIEVERSIGRPTPTSRRAALAPGKGREARTVVRPIERFGAATLVEAELFTGRTHQVRVHLSYLGHPVLGDDVYGAPKEDPLPAPRLALHAAHLAFAHPRTGERLTFTLPLPSDLDHLVVALRRRTERRPPLPKPPRSKAPRRRPAGATPPNRPRRPAGATPDARPRRPSPRAPAGQPKRPRAKVTPRRRVTGRGPRK
jgi:23S rRNA pseudouridine1911/1915/1917 synthase